MTYKSAGAFLYLLLGNFVYRPHSRFLCQSKVWFLGEHRKNLTYTHIYLIAEEKIKLPYYSVLSSKMSQTGRKLDASVLNKYTYLFGFYGFAASAIQNALLRRPVLSGEKIDVYFLIA